MLPKYEQIKQDLLREIKNHTFIPGDKFYSEADIKRKYAVSSIRLLVSYPRKRELCFEIKSFAKCKIF